MKKLVLLLSIVFATQVYAEVPRYFTRTVTCDQIKQDLSNYGAVKVLGRFLGRTTSITYYDGVTCGFRESKVKGVFKTKDLNRCVAGVRCQREPRDPCGHRLCK